MEILFHACRALSIVAFLSYGLACLGSQSMRAEFERFGLAHLRILTGTLEVLAALGLLVGYAYPPLVTASAGGLSLLMLVAIGVRARSRDRAVVLLPAFALLLVNLFVFAYSL